MYDELIHCLHLMKTHLNSSIDVRKRGAYALFRIVTDDEVFEASALGQELLAVSDSYDRSE